MAALPDGWAALAHLIVAFCTACNAQGREGTVGLIGAAGAIGSAYVYGVKRGLPFAGHAFPGVVGRAAELVEPAEFVWHAYHMASPATAEERGDAAINFLRHEIWHSSGAPPDSRLGRLDSASQSFLHGLQ